MNGTGPGRGDWGGGRGGGRKTHAVGFVTSERVLIRSEPAREQHAREMLTAVGLENCDDRVFLAFGWSVELPMCIAVECW